MSPSKGRGMRLVLLGALALLASCQQASEPQNVATASPTAVTPAPHAIEVAGYFAKAGLAAPNAAVVTEQNDTNQLMGRPNQYTSKVFFYDLRHPKGDADENENTVEVFANAEDAKARQDYAASVTKGVPMATQYQILRGPVLVRFDKALLPSEVDQYRDVLNKSVPAQ